MTPRDPVLISPDDLFQMLHSSLPEEVLILDIRVFAQYSKSRVRGALNLCAPTTLLKRPVYTVKKLSETFANKGYDRNKFESWRNAKAIVVYDLASWTLTQAASCVQVAQKFLNEKWQGSAYVLEGGFNAFSQRCPSDVDENCIDHEDENKAKTLSINPSGPSSLAGGCQMPTENTVKPFFNTIRQNMDLIGGVGQFPLRRPAALMNSQVENMPAWLRKVSEPKDEGKTVADRFLAIEKAEQQRMQKALSVTSWVPQRPTSPSIIRMAGIEKGTKNRYKDILPFENTRVRLREKNTEGCDYVNASHVRPTNTRMHYIACQAPTPATFQDFWRVIWEQGARVIVMLTAESEEGHLKAHRYWSSGKYGNFSVKLNREEDQDLHYGPDSRPQRTFSIPVEKPHQRTQPPPPLNRRHTSNTSPSHLDSYSQKQSKPSPDSTIPHVTVRRLQLTNTSDSSQPSRPISQVQLASWPDTGAPTRPKDILALAELCDSLDTPHPAIPPPTSGIRPLIVHCSAGCGRTGAFCTVANVKHMLKKQLAHREARFKSHHASKTPSSGDGSMDVDGEEWISDEEVDLVALTVSEFRLHRMSMVQTLRQFVLCYEAIMELFVHDDWCEHEGTGHARVGGDAMDVEMDLGEPSELPPTRRVAKRPEMAKRAKSGL